MQLLCKLCSGKYASYHFATEITREIEANTAFSILGATLIQNAAMLIYKMDKGHRLLDRFTISVPRAKTNSRRRRTVLGISCRSAVQGFRSSTNGNSWGSQRHQFRTYCLDASSAQIHCEMKTEHVNEVNSAIENGEIPQNPKAQI